MDTKKRNPFIGFLFALIEPGAGFNYLGKLRIGVIITICYYVLAFILLFFGIIKSLILSVIFLFAFVLFRIGVAIYVLIKASQLREIEIKKSNRWFVYVIFCLVPFFSSYLLELSKPYLPAISFMMPTSSMEPTVYAGESFVVDQKYYNNHEVNIGDIVVFHLDFRLPQASGLNMKRVIAKGKQKVQIRDGIVYIDDERILPTLLTKRTSKIKAPEQKDVIIFPRGAGNDDQYGPVFVPDGKFFVLGDYRDNSFDSRYFGFIDSSTICGRPLYIYSSDEPSRIGMLIK